MSYQNYLQSEHWKELKKLKWIRSKKRCAVCDITKGLDVHHLKYKNLYDVGTNHLRLLCRRCHFLLHDLMKAGLGQIRGPGSKGFGKLRKLALKVIRTKLVEDKPVMKMY